MLLGKDGIEEVEERKMSRDEIEAITLLYDNMSYDERIRTPKPKGYRQPDMDFPRKGRKPRNRKQNYERRKK